MFKIIVAVNELGVIGKDNVMPWHCKEDLQHFRKTTVNQNLVMGRKTIDGLPKKLDKRKIFTVSRSLEGENIINDFEHFLKTHENTDEVFYIAGGAQIYKKALPYTKELLISKIPNRNTGDTHFPDFNESLYDLNIIKYNDFDLYHYVRKDN